jgi:hypothetical protein
MLHSQLEKESPEYEIHLIKINGKTIKVFIEKGDDGPVLTIEDHGVTLRSDERNSCLEEIKELANDFASRRLFGTFRPKHSTLRKNSHVIKMGRSKIK